MKRYLLGAVCATCLLIDASATAQARFADLVFRNGEIYTAVDARPWVEAVAVSGGRIAALGTEAEVRSLIGPKTDVVDLGGRMAMPGLNDVHVHATGAARELARYTCILPPYASFEVLLTTVRACGKSKGPDEWIVGQAFGSNLMPRLERSDAMTLLDEAAGGRPVLLRSDTSRDRWVSSRALQLAGYTKDTTNPARALIGRDPQNGELNGLLFGAAGSRVDALNPQPPQTPEQTLADLRVGIRMLNGFGVTMFQEAGGSPSMAQAYHELDQKGELTLRVNVSMRIDPMRAEAEDLDRLFANRASLRSERVSLDFAKMFIDGNKPTQTAFLLEPYLATREHAADSGYRGVPLMPAAVLNRIVTDLDKRGISVKMHTSGDGAVRMAIDSVAAARAANGPNGPLHQMAHAGVMAPSDMVRVPKLNIAVDASPTMWYPGAIQDATAAVMGKERADRLFPFKTFLQEGILVAGGSDWRTVPGEFSEIWSGIEGMVTRQNPTGKIPGTLWPEQAIDVASALKMYTINSAVAMRKAAVTGSLEVGKSADLIVLSQNLFKIKPEAISETTAVSTYLEGRRVFSTQGAKQP